MGSSPYSADNSIYDTYLLPGSKAEIHEIPNTEILFCLSYAPQHHLVLA